MHSKELQPFGLLGELWWSWQEASVLPAVTALGIVSEAFVALLGPTELMVFLFSLHLVLNCVCVCDICFCVCTDVCTWVLTCRSESDLGYVPLFLLTLFFEIGSLTEP